jgi:hypothetical protein
MNMPSLKDDLVYVDLKGKKTENNMVGNIYMTEDYDQFKVMEGNRNLNLRNLAKIEASSITKQLIIPIQVNSKMEIIDGQHRFYVWRKLSLPIYFIINPDYGLEEVELANTSGALWDNNDFLNKHVTMKLPSYLTFEDLMMKYKLNIADLIKLFAHYQKQSERHVVAQFQQGKFTDVGIEEVQAFLTSLDLYAFFPWSRTKPFVRAYFKLYIHPRFNLERMIKQIELRKGQFVKYSTIDDYLYLLASEVYSYGMGKNLIHYDKQNKRFY